jgi:hypothetical protein
VYIRENPYPILKIPFRTFLRPFYRVHPKPPVLPETEDQRRC